MSCVHEFTGNKAEVAQARQKHFSLLADVDEAMRNLPPIRVMAALGQLDDRTLINLRDALNALRPKYEISGA